MIFSKQRKELKYGSYNCMVPNNLHHFLYLKHHNNPTHYGLKVSCIMLLNYKNHYVIFQYLVFNSPISNPLEFTASNFSKYKSYAASST